MSSKSVSSFRVIYSHIVNNYGCCCQSPLRRRTRPGVYSGSRKEETMNLKSCVVVCCVFLSATAALAQVAGRRTPEQLQASYEAHKADFDYLLGDWEFTAVS